MKKALYILLGVLLLLGAGAAFALSRIDTASLTQKIADLSREATGKPLLLSQTPSISLMPLGVSFGPAAWGMQDGKAAAQGLSASIQGGTISMQLMPLFSGKIVVDKVVLNKPVITVRPDVPAPSASAASPQKPAKDEPFSIPPVELTSLHIVNGSVDMDNGQGQKVRLNALDLKLNNLAPGKDADSQLSVQIDVSQHGTTLVAGKLTQKGQIRLAPEQVTCSGLEVTFNPEKGRIPASAGPVRLKADASFALAGQVLTLTSLQLSAAHTDMSLSGVLHLDPLTFTGNSSLTCAPDKMLHALGMAGPLPRMPQSFNQKFALTFANNKLDIPEYTATLDKSTITGSLSLTLPQGKQPLTVHKRVRIDQLNLDQYLDAASTEKNQDAKSAQSMASAPAPSAAPASSLPTVDADITIASLTVRKITLQNLHVALKGTAGRYNVQPASFTLASGGSVESNSIIDLSTLHYSSQGKASNINVGALLQAMQGKSPVSGTAQMDYALTCAGASATAIKSSLSGKGLLLVQNIVLKDVKLLPKDTPANAGQQPTNFERLSVPFTAKNGMVNLSPISLTSSSVNAKGQGMVNLPQSTLNMSADIVMLGITVPVVASGSFSNLSYGVDPAKMLKGVLTNPNVIKEAGNILQQGGKGAQGVGGALKGLFGK